MSVNVTVAVGVQYVRVDQVVFFSWQSSCVCVASCARMSLFLGDAVKALIVGVSHFFFLAVLVLVPPKRTCRHR